MIKIIYICDKCGKQKTSKYTPSGWHRIWDNDIKHYCSKKCKPRPKKAKVAESNSYTSDDYWDDPGVGSLYGRT